MKNVRPEKQRLTLGFIPLLDCAPLVVARELGFFEQQGLDVVLAQEASWGSIRDKVAYGIYDGAQMLSPIPIASTLGLGSNRVPMISAFTLSRNGNAITLSRSLYNQIHGRINNGDPMRSTADAIKDWISTQPKTLQLATVYPYSCHHYQLRYWLSSAGIDPDRDVNLLAIPPTRMVSSLSDGLIDGFCVGEPWGSLAEHRGVGTITVTGFQIWPDSVEKVIGVTQKWAELYPATHAAVIRALSQACSWLEKPDNRTEMLDLLSLPPYLDKMVEHLKSTPSEHPIRQRFQLGGSNAPDVEHGEMLIRQMKTLGQLQTQTDGSQLISHIYRNDLYEAAIQNLVAPTT